MHYSLKNVLCALLLAGIFACSPGKTPVTAPATDGPKEFTWRRYEGAEISVLIAEHRVTDGMRAVIDEFEALTGMEVRIDALAEDLYFDRMELALRAPKGVADVYFLPMDSTGYAQWAAGLIHPLDPFLNDPAMTSEDYAFDGFPAQFLAAAQFPPGAPDAQQYAIPASFEAYILFYNKELVDKYLDGQLPQSMAELTSAAMAIKEASGGETAGAVMRGIRSDTILDTVTGMIFNHWGPEDAPLPYNVWFNGDWSKPRLTDPRVVAGLTDYARMMAAGPRNILAMDWPDATLVFSQGKAAFYIDASLFGPGFEDPVKSAIAGKVGYAPLPPPEPGGESRTGHWMWGLGIPANAQNPGAGWLFIQWLTSKEIEPKVAAFHGGAPRTATWSDPAYTARLNPEYVATVETAMQTSRSTAEFREGWKEYAIEIAGTIQSISTGADPAEAAAKLQETILTMSAP